jgi:malate/lactate dehydrogenase
MKISIIGSSGKVGRQIIQTLLLNGLLDGHELVLFAQNVDRITGTLEDIRRAIPISLSINRREYTEPKIIISSDYEDIGQSDLVVLCASTWPSMSLKEEFKKSDPSGRLIQSYINFNLVKNMSEHILAQCKDAHVIVVTNQSDMMAETVRDVLASKKVIGMGGMVDSSRLRMLIARKMGISDYRSLWNGNHMIGYHNSDMFALRSTITIPLSESEIEKIENEVRNFGSTVSRLQKNFNFPNLNTGASVLPGMAIAVTISAFVGNIPSIVESFTVELDEKNANLYGAQPHFMLSIPIQIFKGNFSPAIGFSIEKHERDRLKEMQRRFYEDYSLLKERSFEISRRPS